jgi:hypothetical protein
LLLITCLRCLLLRRRRLPLLNRGRLPAEVLAPTEAALCVRIKRKRRGDEADHQCCQSLCWK